MVMVICGGSSARFRIHQFQNRGNEDGDGDGDASYSDAHTRSVAPGLGLSMPILWKTVLCRGACCRRPCLPVHNLALCITDG